MKFEFYTWEDGEWKKTFSDLRPGDAIKGTPWTLVDFRPTGTNGDNRAILVNEAGEMESRFYTTDKLSPDYIRLNAALKPATASATPSIGFSVTPSYLIQRTAAQYV